MQKRLRFFAYQTSDGLWVAHCIDLSLAAQGDTFEDVQKKLHAQVIDFCDYVSGLDDGRFQRQLLNRKAPFGTRARYWFAVVAGHLGLRLQRSNPEPPRSWTESPAANHC